MKVEIIDFFRILSQGPPNPGFMQEKVQKGDFLKKPSQELNPSNTWKGKLEVTIIFAI